MLCTMGGGGEGEGRERGGGGEVCDLAPSFSPTSEANDSMRLGILDDLCQVLHVGGIVCASVYLLVGR